MAETKTSGTFELACGHQVTTPLDVEKRHRCPVCKADTIVRRVIK
jgi:predicted Zn-ribbon and HTH transcriptional regulator